MRFYKNPLKGMLLYLEKIEIKVDFLKPCGFPNQHAWDMMISKFILLSHNLISY